MIIQLYFTGIKMENIEIEKMISEIKGKIPNPEENKNYGNFDKLSLNQAQENGYKIIFDKLSNGSGIKKFINIVVLKFTRNHLLQIIEMQNSVNQELLKKIEEQNNRIDYLETIIKGK